eukprot:jgi/Chrzof1/164/Cz01g05210.t1
MATQYYQPMQPMHHGVYHGHSPSVPMPSSTGRKRRLDAAYDGEVVPDQAAKRPETRRSLHAVKRPASDRLPADQQGNSSVLPCATQFPGVAPPSVQPAPAPASPAPTADHEVIDLDQPQPPSPADALILYKSPTPALDTMGMVRAVMPAVHQQPDGSYFLDTNLLSQITSHFSDEQRHNLAGIWQMVKDGVRLQPALITPDACQPSQHPDAFVHNMPQDTATQQSTAAPSVLIEELSDNSEDHDADQAGLQDMMVDPMEE